MTEPKELNGANLVVLDTHNRILVHRELTRKKLLMLPGGGVERGESPRHAAQAETEEETGIITDEATFRLVGFFVQRPSGTVFLYDTAHYSGQLITEPNEESSEALFMSLEEIVHRQEDFRTSSLRMILRYIRCVNGIDNIPYEGRLSDPVEFPANLRITEFSNLVLRV